MISPETKQTEFRLQNRADFIYKVEQMNQVSSVVDILLTNNDMEMNVNSYLNIINKDFVIVVRK